MKSFQDLDVWKKSRVFRKEISILARRLPKEEKYRLVDQMIRSSRSITSNIAEGYGRFHYQENIQYCRQSRGSMEETMDHLITALDEGYIDQERLEELDKLHTRCIRLINGYINYLRKSKNG